MLYEHLDGLASAPRSGWPRRCGRPAAPRRPGPSATSLVVMYTPADRPARRGRERAVLRPDRLRRRRPALHRPARHPRRRRTTTSRCCWTGAHRPPGRSTWPPPSRRKACAAAATSRPLGREVTRLDDEVLDLAAAGRTGRPSGLTGEAALLAALNASRTGQMTDIVETIQVEQDWIIRSAAQGRAGRPGRPGHREDRRGAAPRRVPAVHLPRAAGPARRAGDRAEPHLPALRRAGAAVAGRDLGPAVHDRRPVPGRHRAPRRARRRPRRVKGRLEHGQGDRRRRARPAGGIAVGAGGPLRGGRAAARPAARVPGSGTGPGAPGCRTTRPGRSPTACSSTPWPARSPTRSATTCWAARTS